MYSQDFLFIFALAQRPGHGFTPFYRCKPSSIRGEIGVLVVLPSVAE